MPCPEGPPVPNILGIAGSPRKGGNTELLMERVLAAAQRGGAATVLFTLAGKTISPCLACGVCVQRADGCCVQKDDMAGLYPLLLSADTVVFGTPVYLNTMSAQLKAVLDRCRPLWWKDRALSGKVVAVVTVGAARWGGQEVAAQHVFTCAFNHGMTLPGSAATAGWQVCAVGRDPGDVLQDSEALSAAEDLGRRLARLKVEVG